MDIPDLYDRKNHSVCPVPRKRTMTPSIYNTSNNNSSQQFTIPPRLIVRKDECTNCQNNCNAISKSDKDAFSSETLNVASLSRDSANSPVKGDINLEPVPSLLLRKETCDELQKLECAQIELETSMYTLLNLTKELRKHEIEHGANIEIDRRRRIEITKILQTLRLQKKNSDNQNELLRKEISAITKSFCELQDYSMRISEENVNLKAQLLETKHSPLNDNDCNSSNMKISTVRREIKKCITENANLKAQYEKVCHEIKEKNAENETCKLRLKQFYLKQDSKLKSVDFQTNKTEKNKLKNYDQLMFDFESIQSKYSEFLEQFENIKRLYLHESEQRKILTNELQELHGNIRVMCRFKPNDEDCQFTFNSNTSLSVSNSNIPLLPSLRTEDGQIRFNHIFEPNSTQTNVFDEIRPLIVSCMDGYNVCLMAYGPTGSGKTYTMQGVRGDPGIAILAVHELCEICNKMRGAWNIYTSISMLEIYNEVIYDLLHRDLQAVRISDDGTDVKILDAEIKTAQTEDEFLYWIGKGHARRKIASTKLNLGSSRSHLIIQIHIDMVNNLDMSKRCSTLVFCDLAGSENVERIEARGSRAIETGFINKSLTTLGRVFESLRNHSMLVPYRDSKLTHFLKPCLSEQAKCVLIISISAARQHFEKSMKALEFGLKVMQISLGKLKRNVRILPSKNPLVPCNGDKRYIQSSKEKEALKIATSPP